MPLGIQRLNAKKTQPNDRIVFIKPLKGKDEAIAREFLERIAAQCLPIMREHHLSITTLEEHEPNREFVGRNFNAGEVVQLVLRSGAGWLPFGCVQMVMMHELAHCVHMNHSRAFWATRNLYADQMRVLWTRGYAGEGLWGRGAGLATGQFEHSVTVVEGLTTERLCGGTYRTRGGGKRRRKKRKQQEEEEQLSYAEKKQRRIERKFGKNGVALGADEAVKVKLEKGKRTQAKPRVAGSNRGRELRAAAALARFEQQKEEEEEEEEPDLTVKHEEEGEDGEESDYEDIDSGLDDAVDVDGSKLLDSKGNSMVKVCEDEDPDDAANELKELRSSSITKYLTRTRRESGGGGDESLASTGQRRRQKQQQEDEKHVESASTAAPATGADNNSKRMKQRGKEADDEQRHDSRAARARRRDAAGTHQQQQQEEEEVIERAGPRCAVCSFENRAYYSVTCAVCAHVLDPASVPGTWSCEGPACRGSEYLNAGDCGTCGVCGQRRGGGGGAEV